MYNAGHIILTGKKDSGKSTDLYNFYKQNKKRLKISGWISQPFIQNGLKSGYDILFLKKSMASKPKPFFRLKPFKSSKKWKRFYVDFSIFKTADKISKIKNSDVFIVDEIGPLELNEKKGFYPMFADIYKNSFVITVVRPSLIRKFIKMVFQSCVEEKTCLAMKKK